MIRGRMIRSEWTISWKPAALHVAITKKLLYHTNRKLHWEGEQTRLKTKISESGITLVETPETPYSSFSNNLSGRAGMVAAHIDPKMQEELAEANNKVAHHTKAIQDYTRWKQFFTHAPEDKDYELTLDDAIHFGIIE